MDKSQKLKEQILSKYRSIREFSKKVGIPNSTLVTALDSGVGGMAVDKVVLICEELGIDIKTFEPLEQKNVLTAEELSKKETLVIKKYRSLNESGKKKVDEYVNDLTDCKKYTIEDEEYSEEIC